MKQVRETVAAKMLQVFVVIKGGKIISTIHSRDASSGMCTVDVWGKCSIEHQGRAGGGGYDKFTSALSGAKVGGILLTDHCGGNRPPYPKGFNYYPTESKPPKGYYFANGVEKGYSDCFRHSGLSVLEHYGMTVEQVL